MTWDLLAHNQDLWEKRKIADDKKPQMGFFSTASLKYYVCRADVRPKINCLRDMINFRIALHPPGTSYYPVDMATYRALGIYEKGKKNMRPMDMSRYPEALATGEADVCSPYGGVGTEALPSWAIELDRRVKIKYIPPSPEESEMLNKIPALPISTQPINKTVWSQDIGTDKITGNASSYGMHFRPDLDPELVYKFMKIVFERWDEVYATTTLCDAFGPGEKAKEVNTSLISSFVGSKLKLHPGAAKFYKEIKWWQDSWSKLLP